MKQILLNEVHYEVKGQITKRAINPWIAKVSSGGTTYDDASNAQLEEFHDFRNGIGKRRGVGSDARLEFSEGIDFTTEGQAVLGGLVTTAGAFGVAPVKIIDFDGATYAIGDDLISEWETTKWTSRSTALSDPLDAIVITDDTDEYIIASSASEVFYSTDGTTWTRLLALSEPPNFLSYTEVDTPAKLTVAATKITAADADNDEANYVYFDRTVNSMDELDVDFEMRIESTSTGANAFGGMAISNTVGSFDAFAATDISVLLRYSDPNYTIVLERGAAVAEDTYTCSANTLYYCTLKRTAGSGTVTCEIYSNSTRTTLLDTLSVSDFSTTKYRYVYGFVSYSSLAGGSNFDGYVQNLTLNNKAGYMADYANKLWLISTDGKTVHSSSSKNIDAYGDVFSLTGNFGTVYDLYEGKLLADGTPTIYFCGTEGLYSLDTTNEIAYRQEVEYPPLTYSGHKGMYWNGSVWVSTGFGILKVTPSLATFVGPDLDDGLPATYQGSVYDMVTVNNWLIYCVNKTLSTDKSSIFKRNSSYGGSLQLYTSAADTAIACLHHSPSSLYTNGRLWWGEGTDIKYMMFPDTTSNAKQVSTYTYVDDSGYATFPIFRKLAVIPKVALGVGAITKSCDSNEYVQVFYGLNGAVATTSLGTFKSSPHPTILTFASGVGTEFYTVQFAFKLFRGSTTTNSPELESLLFYYLPRPVTVSAWTFNIVATDENAEATITALEAVRDTNTLVVFNETGDSAKTSFNHYVALSTMPLQFVVENQNTRAGIIQITCEEVFNG